MKHIAIVQSNYIPWKGYFDLIATVDEFVLYDDMQYTRRDWRNRNQIKTPQGLQWLTVPVITKGKYLQAINQTQIDGRQWMHLHWKSLSQNYQKSPFFKDLAQELEQIYLHGNYTYLSELNASLIQWINRVLGINTLISSSSDYRIVGDRSEKLLSICQQAGATHYWSGPSAKDYLDSSLFERHGIQVHWFDYPAYPEYPQLWGQFSHTVTILDVLFNCGPNAAEFALVKSRELKNHDKPA